MLCSWGKYDCCYLKSTYESKRWQEGNSIQNTFKLVLALINYQLLRVYCSLTPYSTVSYFINTTSHSRMFSLYYLFILVNLPILACLLHTSLMFFQSYSTLPFFNPPNLSLSMGCFHRCLPSNVQHLIVHKVKLINDNWMCEAWKTTVVQRSVILLTCIFNSGYEAVRRRWKHARFKMQRKMQSKFINPQTDKAFLHKKEAWNQM